MNTEMAAPVTDLPRHFDFFSETVDSNSTKLDRKQDLNVLFVLGLIGKPR